MTTPDRAGLGARLYVAMQYLLPQHALSSAMFWLTQRPWPRVAHWAIRAFVRLFKVDLREAAEPDPLAYPSFNAFFTRALRADARSWPTAADAIGCPVDGRISQIGSVTDDRLIQAKGRDYSVTSLLGGDPRLAAQFRGGQFATLYLSPRDYHRIHMPIAGQLSATIQVPGRLFSVNPTTVASVPRLFARNERVVCLFETHAGPMAVILVGAIFVGSIETVWAGRLTPPRAREVHRVDASASGPQLARGDELGRFNMGSTVILLFPAGRTCWEPSLQAGMAVRCGEAIGRTMLRA
jgi:phosphatidylserine decarboxylase